jgi:hypothetical protein
MYIAAPDQWGQATVTAGAYYYITSQPFDRTIMYIAASDQWGQATVTAGAYYITTSAVTRAIDSPRWDNVGATDIHFRLFS